MLAELDADVDAIKVALVPPIADTTYSDVALNGALDAQKLYMRVPTVTTSASVGTFNTDDFILFNGWDATDHPRTLKVRLTDPDGGETVLPLESDNGPQLGIDKVSSIFVPAQLLAAGTISFGVAADAHFDHDDMGVEVLCSGAQPREVILVGPDDGEFTVETALSTSCRHLFKKVLFTGSTSDPITVWL